MRNYRYLFWKSATSRSIWGDLSLLILESGGDKIQYYSHGVKKTVLEKTATFEVLGAKLYTIFSCVC